METKQLALSDTKFKAEGDGRFTGYASVFGGLDSYNDTIVKGAYLATIKNRQRPIRMRWNHYGPVIGKWVGIEEDEKGLLVTGEITPGHSVANDVYASMKHGAVDGMSIGFRVIDSEQKDDIRLLKQIELVEISVVEEPADLGATVSDIKSAIESAHSLAECEAMLRDSARFSRKDACALVSRIKFLARGDRAAEEEAAALAAAFQRHA